MTRRVRRALWLLVFGVALGLSWLIPPMQSPDETSHIARAYLIAQGDWLLQAPPPTPDTGDDPQVAAFVRRAGGQADVGGRIDQALLRFMDSYLKLALDSSLRFSTAQQDSLDQLRWSTAKTHLSIPGTGYYFPLVYAPQAAGLALSMALDLSIEHSYRLARALTLLVCFALLAAACRLLAPNPLALATLLLPMSLFQLLSPTLDGLTTSLGLLAVSLFLRNIAERASWASALMLAVCVFVLATSRTHLLALLVLPFYVAWRNKSARDLYLAIVVAAGALAWVLFALHATSDTRVLRSFTTQQLLLYYASDPMRFFRVVFASLTEPELATFYQQSFIGILGWLDTRLPGYFYPSLWVGLGLCGLVSVSLATLHEDWHARLLLAGAALASVGLIFLALLVTWTPHPASVVQGVQGRYFVVPVLLLGYALQGTARVHSSLHGALIKFVVTGFTFVSLWALITTLLSRYH